MLRVLLWIVAVIVILILICFVYHRYRLNAEKKLREPLGQLVDINGNNMSIYVEGSGSRTLVFLSGSGTCSPILDFKSLDLCQYFGHKKLNFSPSITYAERIIS